MSESVIITGGVLSVDASTAASFVISTVIVKLAVPTFPAASDAVQVTVVVPTGKLEPEYGEQVGPEVTPAASDAVAFVNTTVLPVELEVEFVMLDDTFTVGGVMSMGSCKETV